MIILDEYRLKIEDYRKQSRGGKGIITYKRSEKTGALVGLLMVTDDNDVMMITNNGTIIRVHAKDISIFGRTARGVTLMKASGDNYITGCDVTSYDEGEESVSPVEAEEPAEDMTDVLPDEAIEETAEDMPEEQDGSDEDKDNN